MRILIDCCNYFLDNNNNGDRAVYTVLTNRLRHFWPAAEISWITLDPQLIQQTMENVSVFTLEQRHTWELFKPAHTPNPNGILGLVSTWWGGIFPNKDQRSLIDTISDINIFIKHFREADLVIAIGGGSFSDHFAGHAIGLLDTLEGGHVFRKPVALLSVGFEQISSPSLIEKYRQVLPHLDLIACRESNIGPKMLFSFGVSEQRIYVTGDEAIELAYNLRTDRPGHAIGVNLRQSTYSEIDDEPIESMKRVIHRAGHQYNAALLGVPISIFGPSDIDSIRKIVTGYDGMIDGGEKLDSPEKVIRQIGNCRIVVTGSYHSAVFALSQGIPVVAIARSLHYQSKLSGLTAQFGPGCLVVNLDDQNFEEALQDAVTNLWNHAGTLKEPLLEKARLQIDEGWNVARHLFDTVTNSGKKKNGPWEKMYKSKYSAPKR